MKMLPEAGKRRPSVSELLVVQRVTEFLVSNGYRVRHEVPNMGQSVDLAATHGRWLTLVEVKLKDWRNALEQCVAHEQVADFICVAVALERASSRLVAQIRGRGYGLIVCPASNCHCEWALRPRRNRKVWYPQRRRLASLMRKIDYAH